MVSERCGQLADLGAAYAQQGELEQACSRLGEAFTLASQGGHKMRLERVRAVRRRYLGDWSDEPAVRHLDERMRAGGLGPYTR